MERIKRGFVVPRCYPSGVSGMFSVAESREGQESLWLRCLIAVLSSAGVEAIYM